MCGDGVCACDGVCLVIVQWRVLVMVCEDGSVVDTPHMHVLEYVSMQGDRWGLLS